MLEERPSFLTRVLRGLDGLRRFLVNVLFFGLLAGLVIAGLGGRPKVPDGAALVLNIRGTIVEELAAVDPIERIVARNTGAGAMASETLLKDLVDALRLAKDDARIKAVYLDTNDMAGGGFAKLRVLRAAIADFKKSGKKVIAYGDDYLQSPYYLAAQADEVYLHPQGMVLIYGFGGYYNFYKEGLDRFGIEMHVFRVGEYKSAVEPYLRDDMSKEAREMSLDTLGDLWRGWLADVAAARKITPDAITALVEAAPDRLRAAGGDAATLAKDAKLVDTLAPRDEVRKRLIALVGEDKENHSFKQVGFAAYLKAKGGDRSGARGRGKAVAVVVAKGTILDGTQPAGTVGGDSTAKLLRRAREDESVRAVVLRVDSPGGSAFASEIIRRECELVRQAGKPLVVSMGSLAASGGYWIATASDEIWAAPETITGSIGIFGVFPSIHKPLAKYFGIHADGVGTTRFTDAPASRPAARSGSGRHLQAVDRQRLPGLHQPRGPGAQDEPGAGGQDRPRPDLERRRREAARARGPARHAAAGDRVGRGAREAREGLPRVVRREGEELPRAGGGAAHGRRRGRGWRRRAHGCGTAGLTVLGAREPAADPAGSPGGRPLERPPRDLRPLPVRGRLAPLRLT